MKRRRESNELPQVFRAHIIGAGPRVVLLHGGPGLDHHVLLPFAEELAAHYEVWLPDLPGHGARASKRRAPSLSETLTKLERGLAGMGGALDVLAGHSLGALLARELVRRGAVRPKANVWIAPPAGDRERATLAWPRVRRERRMTTDAMRQALLAEIAHETGRPPTARFVDAVTHCQVRAPQEHEALLKQLSLLLSKPTPRCRTADPVLVISGDRDGVVTPHQASCVASATPGAELVVVPGAGHVPAAVEGDDTAERVHAFLSAALQVRR